MGIGFFAQEKTYPKEACDVRSHHSTLFPFWSNQNYQSECYSRCRHCTHPDAARRTLCTSLPRLRPQGHWRSQLDPAQGAGPEHGHRPGLAGLSLPQSVLRSLPWHSYRGSGALSSLFESHPTDGALRISIMPIYDRLRGRSAPGVELENGQEHRQILLGARLRAARFKRPAYFGGRRDLRAQGPSLPDGGPGLSERPGGLCRKTSPGRHAQTLFQSAQPEATRRHRGGCDGHVEAVHQSR